MERAFKYSSSIQFLSCLISFFCSPFEQEDTVVYETGVLKIRLKCVLVWCLSRIYVGSVIISDLFLGLII